MQKLSIVGGCGHVGLPLGVAFAKAGLQVTLVDRDTRAIERVMSGRFPFQEEGGDEALRGVVGKTLTAQTQGDCLLDSDCVVFVTGTPVDEHLNPRADHLLKVFDEYHRFLKPNHLAVLRSTIFPGVFRLIDRTLKAKGINVSLAFCPERVAQGFTLREIKELPQIVSALDRETEDRAADLFAKVAPEILRLTPEEAELAKLFANSWRYIEFAAANQHYMIAEAHGVNFSRVFEALTYHYPRAESFARPGFAAGPCLLKDTLQLSAFYNHNFFLGHASMLINEGLPAFVVQSLERKLKTLERKKIGLLGMSFKANCDDIRDSLSYKVKRILETYSAEVMDTDVYQSTASRLPEILANADAFFLGVPHNEYRNLDLKGRPFVDCWGVWEPRPDLLKSTLNDPHRLKAA